MTAWHYSTRTKSIGKCVAANPEDCEFGVQGAPHWNSLAEAKVGYGELMNHNYGEKSLRGKRRGEGSEDITSTPAVVAPAKTKTPRKKASALVETIPSAWGEKQNSTGDIDINKPVMPNFYGVKPSQAGAEEYNAISARIDNGSVTDDEARAWIDKLGYSHEINRKLLFSDAKFSEETRARVFQNVPIYTLQKDEIKKFDEASDKYYDLMSENEKIRLASSTSNAFTQELMYQEVKNQTGGSVEGTRFLAASLIDNKNFPQEMKDALAQGDKVVASLVHSGRVRENNPEQYKNLVKKVDYPRGRNSASGPELHRFDPNEVRDLGLTGEDVVNMMRYSKKVRLLGEHYDANTGIFKGYRD